MEECKSESKSYSSSSSGRIMNMDTVKSALSDLSFQVGNLVERAIDGMWFLANVEFYDDYNQELRLRYIDDGNVEERVPVDEVRINNDKYNNNYDSNGNYENSEPVRFISKGETLLKPLAGLIEDDAIERRAHRPTVIMHSSTDTEEAIILNGAENRLAAGGGLRALRYLRKDNKD